MNGADLHNLTAGQRVTGQLDLCHYPLFPPSITYCWRLHAYPVVFSVLG